jgi:hypothetical protein
MGLGGTLFIWEIFAATLFSTAYGAVVLAVIKPAKVWRGRMSDFARGGANLLSAANEADHVDLAPDLQRSISDIILLASFIDDLRETTAFFDFAHRKKIEQAS